MTKITQFSLTLLSALVLSACGGGSSGGGSPSSSTQSQQQISPSSPQTQSNQSAQPNSNPQAQGSQSAQPNSNSQSQGSQPAKPESKPQVQENKPAQPESKPQDQGNEPTQPESKPQDQGNEPTQPESKPQVQENKPTQPESKPQVQENKPAQPESKPQDQGNEPAQPESKPQVQENKPAQPESKPQVQDNETAKPEDKPQVNENPLAKPEDQAINRPSIKSDKEVFNNLSHSGNTIDRSSIIKLELDGKDIQLLPNATDIHINGSLVNPLRDSNGQLLGYYGYAKVTIQDNEEYNPVEYGFSPLYSIDQDHKAIQPTQDMEYNGKMYYSYTKSQAEVKEANVQAIYKQDTKRLAMNIYPDNTETVWKLYDNEKKLGVNITSDDNRANNIVGRLFHVENDKPKTQEGSFSGRIIGSQGQILVGETKSHASITDNNGWRGVVGAEGKPTNPDKK